VQKSTKFIYPDLSVTCDDQDENASNFISHPCLIVEVLSPSTEGYDRGEKFYLYERSNSLKDYVLVNTNKIEINLYKKDDLGKWQIIKYVAGELVELESINLSFPIEEVFRGIKF
jgi:Uma2 family endonuclease